MQKTLCRIVVQEPTFHGTGEEITVTGFVASIEPKEPLEKVTVFRAIEATEPDAEHEIGYSREPVVTN